MEQPQSRRLVLVVDDEPDMREMLGFVLPYYGFDVRTANGGNEAIEVVQTAHFDLVLTDLRMPGMDGFATASALKRIIPELPVVIASGYAPGETDEHRTTCGASAFVRKPFELDELVGLLHQLTCGARASD